MTSINFVFRPSVGSGRRVGSLSLRLIHDRRVRSITIRGYRIYPEEWDAINRQIIYPENNPSRVAYLEKAWEAANYEKDLLKVHLAELEGGEHYTVEELVDRYRQRKEEGKLGGFTEKLAREMESRGQLRTARAYRTVMQGALQFNGGKDIPLGLINSRFVKGFESHLKKKGRLPNTISYYMRNLRAIYNKAVAEKHSIRHRYENPFSGVYTGVTKTMKRSLSLNELQKIHGLDFSALLEKEAFGTPEYRRLENLEKAHRYFHFSFYARGMCFVDMAYLKKENIRGGIIRYVRKKTGRQIEVRITREMQQIIDRFSDEVGHSPYLFPIIDPAARHGKPVDALHRQYESALRAQNNRLKKIARMSGVRKPVSSHWARHSWATVSKQENVPLQVISECLGHSSEKTTLIYLGQLENSLLDEANQRVASAIARRPSCPPAPAT